MKKLLVLVLLMNVMGAFAQSNLRLGVNLDPIATWFSAKSDGIEKDGARPGISGGLMVEYYFKPNYGFTTGLNIASLGGNILYNDSVYINTGDRSSVLLSKGSTVAYQVSYLILPVGLKLKTNEIGYLTYYAQLGLAPQFNIGSKASSTGSTLSKDNVSKETNFISMSYYFGGGIEYNLGGQTSLTAGLFFNNGFADVLSNNNHKAVLNYFSLRVGILF